MSKLSAFAVAAALIAAPPAAAEIIRAGTFSVNADGSEWNNVAIGSTGIDETIFIQEFTIDGETLSLDLVSSSGVFVTHSGTLSNGLRVTITSVVGQPSPTTGILRQSVLITNESEGGLDGIRFLSYVDLDLESDADGDVAQFIDGGILQTKVGSPISVFARTDGELGPVTESLFGALSEVPFEFDIRLCCDLPEFPLNGDAGPVGPDDLTYAFGYEFGLGLFQSFSADFVYSFSIGSVDTPAPAAIALFGLGAAALGFGRRRRG